MSKAGYRKQGYRQRDTDSGIQTDRHGHASQFASQSIGSRFENNNCPWPKKMIVDIFFLSVLFLSLSLLSVRDGKILRAGKKKMQRSFRPFPPLAFILETARHHHHHIVEGRLLSAAARKEIDGGGEEKKKVVWSCWT